MHLRKKGKTRKISLLLNRSQHEQNREIKDQTTVNFMEVKDFNEDTSNKGTLSQNNGNVNNRESNLKKKETPSIVKKYYRPKTGNHRSASDLLARDNSIRGRALKSGSSNRQK